MYSECSTHKWLTCYNLISKTRKTASSEATTETRERKGQREGKRTRAYPLPDLINKKQAEWNDEDWDEDLFGTHFAVKLVSAWVFLCLCYLWLNRSRARSRVLAF